ncbi:hypothetical protein KIN20_004550 [Parelaphostrongylus tenuis]|nr:hypothetical protein KIN20_004550 [Parelaphostrongylus tenuis]
MRIKISQENPLISIACGQFALSLMQAMFMFYYVKVYLVVFHVPQLWFNVAQSLFMLWNAINDPLFGYMQDKPGSWLNSRTRVIRTFAPYLAVSFVLMWIPCMIGVAWSALFADSTKDPTLRVSAVKYSQISILLSINIIVITEKLSHSLENFWTFQLIATFVAIIALVCFIIAGSLKPTLPILYDEVSDKESFAKRKEAGSMMVSMREILFERDFLAIVVTNFVHTARSITHMNFASTATDLLIPQTIIPKGSLRLSLFYGVLTVGPQILLIASKDVVVKYGAYRILMTSYALSVLSGLLFLVSSNPYCVMLFMLIDCITVHSTAPLFNIVISDFIDDDAKRHFRRAPLSSIVFSMNALIVKPAQSIAPRTCRLHSQPLRIQ